MRRRDFAGLIFGALTLPFAARAQEAGRVYRLGVLVPAAKDSAAIKAFFDELRLNGFTDGQNLEVIGSFGVGGEQIVDAAAALVKQEPDAIVIGPERYARVFQSLTRTIPLNSMSEDLVAEGLVASLAMPGGNTTGLSLLSPELDGKRQEILIEAVPGIRRMAALADATITQRGHLQELREAAHSRGVELSTFAVAKAQEIVPALDAAKAGGAEAINFLATPLQIVNLNLMLEHMSKLRLPAVYQWPDSADQGGLIGYGPRFAQVYRQRARQIAKILRGTKPADLPVEQPSNFELVINLKTAKSIGFEIPAGLVLRADTIIE
jgi:putative tryptophan/tyrosine transport system substrate-binding protein